VALNGNLDWQKKHRDTTVLSYLGVGRMYSMLRVITLKAKRELPIYLLACTCHSFLRHYALVTYHRSADVHPHFVSILVFSTRYSVSGALAA
jgi:hypothetical protein